FQKCLRNGGIAAAPGRLLGGGDEFGGSFCADVGEQKIRFQRLRVENGTRGGRRGALYVRAQTRKQS
ncbi:MAG: hypothetical protein ACRD22_11450, partial [Terriglobia bacterium]